MPANQWIDVTAPVREGMPVWPGNTAYTIAKDLDMAKGQIANVSRIALGVHTGTHMDAQLHFIANATSIDTLPLHAVVGPARVIEIEDPVSVTVKELEPHNIRGGERILFKTRNSSRNWPEKPFLEDFTYISGDAAAFLAEKKVLTVGIDYLSVGGYWKDGAETHHNLLGAGIWIVEGLDLSAVEPGDYELVCLPLKLMGAEGAPARAILRKIEST